MSGFDHRELRNTFGTFVTGVTVITTVDPKGVPYGLTANSFSSVSLDPPLVLWSQANNAPSHPIFQASTHFCISILADDQMEISNRFAKAGPSKFDGLDIEVGIHGIPLIKNCAAVLECTKFASYPGGDHTVFVGQVLRARRTKKRTLAFGHGRYLSTQPYSSTTADATGPSQMRAVRLAARDVPSLSERVGGAVGIGVWGNRGPTMVRWEAPHSSFASSLQSGMVLPLLKSSTGLVFAAFGSRDRAISALLRELSDEPSPEEAAAATLKAVEETLEHTRAHGASRLHNTSTFAETYGGAIDAVSVPVFDEDARIVVALTVVCPVNELDLSYESTAVGELKMSARQISVELGHIASAS